MFEPFGHGNHKPIFAIQNVSIKDVRKVGKTGNHLSFKLSDPLNDIPVIGFGKISYFRKGTVKTFILYSFN